MALVKCRECGNEVSTEASACPKCGAPVKSRLAEQMPAPPPRDTSGNWPWWAWVAIGVLVLFVAMLFLGSSPANDAKFQEREAIKACWSEQQRKSFDPGTQRFIAGACEMMEAQFTKKHGHQP